MDFWWRRTFTGKFTRFPSLHPLNSLQNFCFHRFQNSLLKEIKKPPYIKNWCYFIFYKITILFTIYPWMLFKYNFCKLSASSIFCSKILILQFLILTVYNYFLRTMIKLRTIEIVKIRIIKIDFYSLSVNFFYASE